MVWETKSWQLSIETLYLWSTTRGLSKLMFQTVLLVPNFENREPRRTVVWLAHFGDVVRKRMAPTLFSSWSLESVTKRLYMDGKGTLQCETGWLHRLEAELNAEAVSSSGLMSTILPFWPFVSGVGLVNRTPLLTTQSLSLSLKEFPVDITNLIVWGQLVYAVSFRRARLAQRNPV